MRKSYIQIVLVMVCIFSTYLVYEQFFKNKSFVQIESENNINNENMSISQSEEKVNSDEKEKNLISNLKYKSFMFTLFNNFKACSLPIIAFLVIARSLISMFSKSKFPELFPSLR